MQAIRWIFAACLFSFALASCNSPRTGTGVGADLYTASLPADTEAQDQYVAAICAQAGGRVVQLTNSVDCNTEDGWSAFVQAGMNDIDARCDAYLVWLDARKRQSKSILKQIGDTQDTTTTLVGIAAPGSSAITILTSVFGLAKNTFDNINTSQLLEAMDHSTVQSVVLRRQQEFRSAILNKSPRNRPAAIYVLRSYLRICMPITIATDINTTISSFDRGNNDPGALVDGDYVAQALTASQPIVVRELPRPTIPFAMTKAELSLNVGDFNAIQASLCLTPGTGFTAETRDGIRVYKRAADPNGAAPADGLLSPAEAGKLMKFARERKACPKDEQGNLKFANYFERQLFDRDHGAELVQSLQMALNQPGNDEASAPLLTVNGVLDKATRDKIMAVRAFRKMPPESAVLSRQVTPDFAANVNFP